VNLLIKQGANLNYESDDVQKPSPLDLAILKGDLPIIELLLENGNDIIVMKIRIKFDFKK
jgi:ankyrin repeat protein